MHGTNMKIFLPLEVQAFSGICVYWWWWKYCCYVTVFVTPRENWLLVKCAGLNQSCNMLVRYTRLNNLCNFSPYFKQRYSTAYTASATVNLLCNLFGHQIHRTSFQETSQFWNVPSPITVHVSYCPDFSLSLDHSTLFNTYLISNAFKDICCLIGTALWIPCCYGTQDVSSSLNRILFSPKRISYRPRLSKLFGMISWIRTGS